MIRVLNVLDEWTKLRDAGISIDVLYTDFQKAFDTVPHRRLLTKLTSYGFSGKVLTWIQSFLTGRKQNCGHGSRISMGMDCECRPSGKRTWTHIVFDIHKRHREQY